VRRSARITLLRGPRHGAITQTEPRARWARQGNRPRASSLRCRGRTDISRAAARTPCHLAGSCDGFAWGLLRPAPRAIPYPTRCRRSASTVAPGCAPTIEARRPVDKSSSALLDQEGASAGMHVRVILQPQLDGIDGHRVRVRPWPTQGEGPLLLRVHASSLVSGCSADLSRARRHIGARMRWGSVRDQIDQLVHHAIDMSRYVQWR
jgi:hypothetical protein